MITNLTNNLNKRRSIGVIFAIFFSLLSFSITAATPNILGDPIANAGADVNTGLCGIKILDGTNSSGDNIKASWKMIDGPLMVNFNNPNTLHSKFQAYEGGQYTFELRVTDENGIIDRDTVLFHVMPLRADVSDDITIGGCTSVVLDATKNSTLGDGYTYEWYDVSKLSDDSEAPTFTPKYTDYNKTVKFYFTVRDSFGCEAVDEFNIHVKETPVAAIKNEVIELGCDSIILDGSWSDGYNIEYHWFPNEFVSTNTNPQYATASNEIENIKLIVEDATGCKDSAEFKLGDHQFYVEASQDIITGTCTNEYFSVKSSNNVDLTWAPSDLISTTWNPSTVRVRATDIRKAMGSDTTSIFAITVAAEREDGCIKRDTAFLTATNTSYHLSAGPNIYSGICGTTILGEASPEYFKTVLWSGTPFNLAENKSETTEIQPELYFGNDLATSNQYLTIKATDIYGCSRSDVSRVSVDRAPIISAQPDTYTSNGCKPIQLNTKTYNLDSISWIPSTFLSDPHIADPVYMGSQATTLKAIGFDKYGCEVSTDITIALDELKAQAGEDKSTTQFIPVYVGSGIETPNYTMEWSLAENYPDVTLSNTDSVYCQFYAEQMGIYKLYLHVSDGNTCNLLDSVNVTVNFGNLPPAIESITADTLSVYAGDDIEFTFTYSSPDDDQLSYHFSIEGKNYETDRIKVAVFKSGWVKVILSDPYSTVTDSIYYTIKPREKVVINNIQLLTDTFYVNDEISLNVQASSLFSPDLTYEWVIGENRYNTASIQFALSQAQWAVVTVSDPYTSASDSIFLSFTKEQEIEPFEISVDMDTICRGNKLSISIEPHGDETERLFYTITYPNGQSYNSKEANSIIDGNGYIVVNVYNTQFQRKDSIFITAIDEEYISLSTIVCQESEVVLNPAFSYPSKQNYTYWQYRSTIKENNEIIVPFSSPGTYHIRRENIYGCIDSATIHVDQVFKPIATNDELLIHSISQAGSIDLASNDSCYLPIYLLQDTAKWGILWLVENGNLQYQDTSIAANRIDSLSYTISSEVCLNLHDTGYVVVHIDNAPILAEHNINGFSPNGDPFNQTFSIANINYYPDNELFIYNKIGHLVYYKKNYDNSWDGQRNKGAGFGNELPEGTYFYVLKAQGHPIVNGFIELRR